MKVREIERKRETLREEGGALQGEWADVPSCSASLGFTTSFPFLLLITNHLYEYIFVNEKAANEILRITSSWLFLCPLKEINDLFDLHWILLIKKPWSYMFFFFACSVVTPCHLHSRASLPGHHVSHINSSKQ